MSGYGIVHLNLKLKAKEIFGSFYVLIVERQTETRGDLLLRCQSGKWPLFTCTALYNRHMVKIHLQSIR